MKDLEILKHFDEVGRDSLESLARGRDVCQSLEGRP